LNSSNEHSHNSVSNPQTQSDDPSHKAKVVVGLSGGVDSAVSLLLLKRAGYAVEAVFMKNWDEDDGSKWCTAAQDYDDARSICAELQVPLRDVNFSHEYWENVFEHFLSEYRRGRTPNPDVICNQQVKFRAFLDYAIDIGAEKIATGHYARIRQLNGSYQLLKALDENKDQSYFLYLLDQEKLGRSMFPLGELPKTQVRTLALESGLGVHGKKDSTGICFIGERPFAEFLTQYINEQPGIIESLEGQQLGQHKGLAFYTIGQRQGLGIGGRASGSGKPWYVVAKDPSRNVLITAQGHDHQALYARALSTDRAHWISGQAPVLPYQCTARIRYRQLDQMCQIEAADDETLVVRFTEPQWAVSPGQSVVFYDCDVCLGGAIINTALS
jgi:tRNA-specific 2-thiouridylase